MEQTNYRNPLGYEPIPLLLRRYALPAVTSMVVNAIYNIVDQLFIGQVVGTIGNAATMVTFPLVTITLGIATMLGSGGSAFASIRLGERKHQLAEKAVGNVLMMAVAFGLLAMAAGLLFLEPILRFFAASPQSMPYAKEYAVYILLGTPFAIGSVCLSNLVRTDGRPMLAMFSLIAGALLNVGLDALFMFGFGWGVMGAALATSLSQAVSMAILCVYFTRFGRMRFNKNSLRPDAQVCLRIMNLGISSCLLQLAGSAMQIVMNKALMHWGNLSPVTGDVAQSAMGIVIKANQIFLSVCIGVSIGNQPILGFNRGANQPRRIKQSYLLAAKVATGVSICGWLVFMCVPQIILGWFDRDTGSFAAFGAHAMRTFLMGAFCVGFQVVSTGYFQATGQPLKATVLSTLRQVVLLIPLILVLPLLFGLDGVLYAGPIADLSAAALVSVFIVHEMKRLNAWIEGTDGVPN